MYKTSIAFSNLLRIAFKLKHVTKNLVYYNYVRAYHVQWIFPIHRAFLHNNRENTFTYDSKREKNTTFESEAKIAQKFVQLFIGVFCERSTRALRKNFFQKLNGIKDQIVQKHSTIYNAEKSRSRAEQNLERNSRIVK